jgi:hypothetical protein
VSTWSANRKLEVVRGPFPASSRFSVYQNQVNLYWTRTSTPVVTVLRRKHYIKLFIINYLERRVAGIRTFFRFVKSASY